MRRKRREKGRKEILGTGKETSLVEVGADPGIELETKMTIGNALAVGAETKIEPEIPETSEIPEIGIEKEIKIGTKIGHETVSLHRKYHDEKFHY